MVATLAETKHDDDVGHEVLVADIDGETEPFVAPLVEVLQAAARTVTAKTATRTCARVGWNLLTPTPRSSGPRRRDLGRL